jgi:hypothetical protein
LLTAEGVLVGRRQPRLHLPPVPGYGRQVHHAEIDWAKGGQTNIVETRADHNR